MNFKLTNDEADALGNLASSSSKENKPSGFASTMSSNALLSLYAMAVMSNPACV